MAKKTPAKKIRISKLKLKNFKAFDNFEIDFPKPVMDDEPDIIVMGSKNGIGKTSILEACSLLFIASIVGHHFHIRQGYDLPLDIFDLLIRADKSQAEIKGVFDVGAKVARPSITMSRNGALDIKDSKLLKSNIKRMQIWEAEEMPERLMGSLTGMDIEPFVFPPLMYFHSYRKIQEGSPELGMMFEGKRALSRNRYRERDFPISSFKLEILRLMLGRADLFEELEYEDAESILAKLNNIVDTYAGGKITKLLSSADSTVDFRIMPTGGESSFSFDGLSSGQKEIISTLFLIWYTLRDKPGIVLIDEPELHLNSEWHRSFIKQLHKLAPDNQYIIATHSEEIFASVDKDRRVILD